MRKILPVCCGVAVALPAQAMKDFAMCTVSGKSNKVNIDGRQGWAKAGVEELMIQWFGLEDIEGLEVLAEHVLPQVTMQKK